MRRLLAVATVGWAMIAAGPAAAAPDRTLAVGAGAPSVSWDVGPLSGLGTTGLQCDEPGFPCDDTLIRVDAPGDLVVSIESSGGKDLDFRLFAADASGTPLNPEPIESSLSFESNERVRAENVAPGFYLAQTAFQTSLNQSFQGTATLVPAGSAGPAWPFVDIDHRATLTRSAPTATWEGAVSGVHPFPCEVKVTDSCQQLHLRLDAPGALTVGIAGAAGDDLQIHLYRSDETGFFGKNVGIAATPAGEETLTLEMARAGWYVVGIYAAQAPDGAYTGALKLDAAPLEPAPPTAIAPAPSPTTKPAARPPAKKSTRAKRRAACRKKARRIRSASRRRKALRRCAKVR